AAELGGTSTNGGGAVTLPDYPYTVHYIGNAGAKNGSAYPVDLAGSTNGGLATGGVLYRDSRVRFADITDGSSNTFLVGEMSFNQDLAGFRCWIRGCNSD